MKAHTPPAAPPPGGAPLGWRRRLGRIARSALRIYLLVVLGMMFMENFLLYHPSRYPEGNWNPPDLEFEDAHFSAADGVKLHGWYLGHENPRAVILFAHGNAGNLADRAPLVAQLHDELRASVLVFDYRGYGKSEGHPTESGILADARAARAWLAQREQIPESQIVLFGRSLGTGVAVDLAARDGARGLILYSGFTSLPDVAGPKYPFLPVHWIMRNRLNAAAIIGEYHGPLLQFHGTSDRIIPYRHGRELFELANEPKQFVDLFGFGHNEPVPQLFFAAADAFLDQFAAPAE